MEPPATSSMQNDRVKNLKLIRVISICAAAFLIVFGMVILLLLQNGSEPVPPLVGYIFIIIGLVDMPFDLFFFGNLIKKAESNNIGRKGSEELDSKPLP